MNQENNFKVTALSHKHHQTLTHQKDQIHTAMMDGSVRSEMNTKTENITATNKEATHQDVRKEVITIETKADKIVQADIKTEIKAATTVAEITKTEAKADTIVQSVTKIDKAVTTVAEIIKTETKTDTIALKAVITDHKATDRLTADFLTIDVQSVLTEHLKYSW